MYRWTPRRCQNRATDVHERIPRSRMGRAQAALFVPENMFEVCRECHLSFAHTREGRAMLAEAANRIFGYCYREDGWWEGCDLKEVSKSWS